MRLSWRHFDFWLLGAVAILTIFGITMIRSAIAENIELLELDVVRRQLIFAVAGFAVILITTAVDYHLWSSASRVLYLFVAVFLILIAVTAGERFGAARWLEVGSTTSAGWRAACYSRWD
jgi:cell division protein FtsW (lipid II flippase)